MLVNFLTPIFLKPSIYITRTKSKVRHAVFVIGEKKNQYSPDLQVNTRVKYTIFTRINVFFYMKRNFKGRYR